jgi:hypothetical protein
MLAILIGLAIALNTAWLLVALVPIYLVIRFGVIAREETYHACLRSLTLQSPN